MSVEPELPPHMMPQEQALAGMLGAFLLSMRFSLDRMDPADQEEFWECVLDRAGIATGGPRGPIERHLFEVM